MRHRRVSPAAALLAIALVSPLRAQTSAYEQLQMFSNLLNQIRLNYVDSVPTERLVHGAIRGMLSALDPHSHYLAREDNERMLAWEAGRLAGLGILLETEDGRPTVQAVLAGSPAERAGVMTGDRLLSVNDTLAAGQTVEALQAHLAGARGMRIRLLLERGSRLEPETLAVAPHTDLLHPRSVSLARLLAPGTAYVRLEQFGAQAGKEIHDALGRLLPARGERRLVLDLRANPGGVLAAVADIASEFLPANSLIYRTRARRTELEQEARTARDGPFRDVALIVLIDRYSASASEALAGALQDHDRALILGRRSFGKALVQQMFLLAPTGDAVWLTIAYLRTPSGRLIQRPYRGLNTEEYFAAAGKRGTITDTTQSYHTDAGRPVRGGGGIEPDSTLAEPAQLPGWWSVAADSGFDDAVADSVAATLGTGSDAQAAWRDAAAEWRARLLPPFLERVRARLKVAASPDTAVASRLARILARRAAEVRWGPDAAADFGLRNDRDVQAAVAALATLPGALTPPHP